MINGEESTLSSFFDPEGLRETGQSHEKKDRSYEADPGQKASELEDLSTVTDLP